VSGSDLVQNLEDYFQRPVAVRAAESLTDGAEVELRVIPPLGAAERAFTFFKSDGRNRVREGLADAPQLVFTLEQGCLEQIMRDASSDISYIGIQLVRRILAPEHPEEKILVEVRTHVMGLVLHGYFGVLKAGGQAFALYMASQGLHSFGRIKELIGKLAAGGEGRK